MAKKGIGLELSTIVTIAFAVFLWTSIFSFHSNDPSFFTESTEIVSNACGWVGAYLASFFLQFFGLGTFLIPVGILFLAVQLHSHEGLSKAIFSMLGVSVSVIALTVFLSLHWKTWMWSQTEFLTGGILGSWLAIPLEKALKPVGASIVALVICLSSIVISTPIGVAHFLSEFVRASSIVLFRISRLVATYAAYYGAVLMNKLAVFIGVQAKKSFEQIKLRVEARKNQLALEAKSPVVPEGATEASMIQAVKPEKKKPVIEVAANPDDAEVRKGKRADDRDEEEGDDEADLEADESEEKEILKAMVTPKIIEVSKFEVAPKPDSQTEMKPVLAPVIQKAVTNEPVSEKPKFKFEKKRGKWKLPIIEFLKKSTRVEASIDRKRLEERARILTDKLAEFGIDGDVTAMMVGPVITLYEFKPGPGIKVSRISGLIEDLSMALSSKSVRILAPLPGKSVVGIEIPSENREQVFLRDFLQTGEFQNPKYQIPVVMGKDISGHSVYADLARMPHLLVSGQTGSGKSVFMNGLICSLLYRFTPDELRLILVDPKFIEFSFYHDIPHLLLPVVDDPKNASSALKWAVREMERRYRILEAAGVRNLQSYNEKVESMGAETMADLLQAEAQSQEENGPLLTGGDWIEAFEKDDAGSPIIGKLPYTVIIIDELADLMMTVKKDVESSIARIAQKARAAGIHLVIATQRPSTDVITGLIKANMPTRVSFSLSSQIDSRTILDRPGAERLLGQGDMLFIPPGSNEPVRLQGAFVDDGELTKITDFLRDQGKPVYRNEILKDEEEEGSEEGAAEDQDPLFVQALEIARETRTVSASFLQRRLQIGYNRAARLIETMEERGIVGPADGSKPREVLIP